MRFVKEIRIEKKRFFCKILTNDNLCRDHLYFEKVLILMINIYN
jgi:hypothetical protein